jgi:universal stress protein A
MVPNPTRILVPTDFSPTADAALAYAKTLAARLDASLHVVHVLADPYAMSTCVPDVYVPMAPDIYERSIANAQEQLRQRLDADDERRLRGSKAVINGGLAAKDIVAYADAHNIDLIVMGTHGRRGVAHLILGSVAEHVVRTSRCPVLTVQQAHVTVRDPAKEAIVAV